jgi:hypothetical protein
MSFQILHNMVNKLRGMSARAQSLIYEDEESAVEGVSATVVNISSLHCSSVPEFIADSFFR